MVSKPSHQAQELLAIAQELDAVDRQAVAAFIQALRAGQGQPAAFDAANAVLAQAGQPPLSWEEYTRQEKE